MMPRPGKYLLAAIVPLAFVACALHPVDDPAAAWSPVSPAAANAADPATQSPAMDYADEYSKYATYSQVEDGLYVGGRVNAPPPGTTAVLCLSQLEDKYKAKVYNWQPIDDGGPAPSLEWLQKQVAFIDAQRKAGGQVYIHCDAGISRGPMVTTAYLMWKHRWTRDQALDFLNTKREVQPNIYFMDLLSDWEDQLKLPAATQAAATQPAP